MKSEQIKKFVQDRTGLTIETFMGTAMAVGIGFIILAVMAILLGSMQATVNSSSTEYTILGYGLTFLSNLAAQFPTIGTIVGVVILLGVVLVTIGGGYMGYQYFKGRGR